MIRCHCTRLGDHVGQMAISGRIQGTKVTLRGRTEEVWSVLASIVVSE